MRKTILAAAIILLTGCAAQQAWVHPTAGQANLASDRYRCEQQALQMFPPVFPRRPYQTAQPTTSNTNCWRVGNNIQCNTVQNPPRQDVAGAIWDLAERTDQNAGRRASSITSCLASMGYQYTTIESQSTSNIQTSHGTPNPEKPSLIRERMSPLANLKECDYSHGGTIQVARGGACPKNYPY